MNYAKTSVKEILIAGVLGAVAIFMWIILSLSVLPFRQSEQIRQVPDQIELHQMLKQRITQPGKYAVLYMSPAVEAQYPGYRDEPIYEINYSGLTHGTVPGLLHPALAGLLLAPMLAAWLLSMAADEVLQKYSRRVLFVTLLGLFLALFGDLLGSLRDEVTTEVLAVRMINSTMAWFFAGLVIAWRVRPKQAA